MAGLWFNFIQIWLPLFVILLDFEHIATLFCDDFHVMHEIFDIWCVLQSMLAKLFKFCLNLFALVRMACVNGLGIVLSIKCCSIFGWELCFDDVCTCSPWLLTLQVYVRELWGRNKIVYPSCLIYPSHSKLTSSSAKIANCQILRCMRLSIDDTNTAEAG